MKIIYEKEIEAAKIVVSPRPVWKCRSCSMYGKTLSCPPHVPSWKETRDWIECFQMAIIVKIETDMNNFEGEKREMLSLVGCILCTFSIIGTGRPVPYGFFGLGSSRYCC